MSPRVMQVGPNFPCDRLSPGEECYSPLPGRMVLVQGTGIPALVFYRGDRLICDCPEAQMNDGDCRHTWALQGGLWSHVFMCPRGHGVVTSTRDWLPRRGHTPTLLLTGALEASVPFR